MAGSAFSQQNINGVYIPSALLILGVAILKTGWVPYAAAFAAIVGSAKVLLSDDGTAKDIKATAAKKASVVSNSAAPVQAVQLGALRADAFQEFPLTNINKTSHNVAIYRFGLPNKTDVLGLPIGQHISLAATPKGSTTEVVRSYTPISSDEEDKGYFDLMIKAYPQGNISAHMTTLKVGDTMKVKGPKGAMVYTPNMCRHIGMIAGGTGITPMLQVIKAIIRSRPRNGGKDTTKVDLIFANVNPDDILLQEDLDRLAREDEHFNVYYVLNNPPEGWKGGVGFVTPEMITTHMPKPADDIKILLCGPPPMVKAMKGATETLGYEKARVVSKLQDQVFAF